VIAATTNACDFITCAPRSVAGWAACFSPESLPVLGSSADALEELAANEDAADAHLIADTLGGDPLLTLKVLAHVGRLQHRRGRDGEAETLTAALVMLGITPFFKTFGAPSVVEDLLANRPDALEGFETVLRRARRAAKFALGFAAHRLDHDAAIIHEAALLHDFADLLLWLRAPDLALQIAARQAAEPALRSADIQRELLHIELPALQHALMQSWRLPSLLVQITDDEAAHPSTQMRNVLLAIRLARHSASGWDNPALPDDFSDIAALLNIGVEPAMRLAREIDAD
jgi:HD-like signal output (HDOD) protein